MNARTRSTAIKPAPYRSSTGCLANEYSTLTSIQCDVCGCNKAIYTCPACETKSCSAACVKQHKIDHDCDGHRKRSKFVPREQLSERELLSDLALLGDGLSELDRSQRTFTSIQEEGPSRTSKKNLRRVKSEAKKHGCVVEMMPENMSKHLRNKSRVDDDKIFWSIDWIIDGHLTHVDGIDATLSIKDALPIAVSNIESLILELHEQAGKEVHIDETIQSVLNGSKIVEFPTFQVKTNSEPTS